MMALADRPRPRARAGHGAAQAPLVRLRLAAARHDVDRGAAAHRGPARDARPAPRRSTGACRSKAATWRCCATCSISAAAPATPDAAAIDARLQEMLRGWGDAVEAALAEHGEPGRAAALAARYAEAFPQAYRAAYGAAEAAQDIERMRRLARRRRRRGPLRRDARLYRHDERSGRPAAAQGLPARRRDAAVGRGAGAREFRLPRAVRAGRPSSTGADARHDPRFPPRPAARRAGRAAARPRRGDRRRRSARCSMPRAEDDVFNRLIVGTGARRAGGRLAARVLPLPAPGERRLHDLHRGRRAARRAGGDARADRAVPGAARSGLRRRPRGRREPRRGSDPRRASPGSPRSTTTACCGSTGR